MSSMPAAQLLFPARRVWLLLLLVVVLPRPLCVGGSYAKSVLLPLIGDGLQAFLSTPFDVVNRAAAKAQLSFLDVSATASGTAEVREFIYSQLVAMDVYAHDKNGIDMVYAGFGDGRFLGYYSVEGPAHYSVRGPDRSLATDMDLAPYDLSTVNSDEVTGIEGKQIAASCPAATPTWPAEATCAGSSSVDGSDCAASTSWLGGSKTLATCDVASGCIYTSTGCIAGSVTACCAENIRAYYDTTLASTGSAGDLRKWNTYDPRVRPWYIQQKALFDSQFPSGVSDGSRSVGWSRIYTFHTSRMLGASATGAILLPNGRFGGVIAVDFPLADVSELLQGAISTYQQGYACVTFVVERDGIDAGKLIGSAGRSVSGEISVEPVLTDTGERPSAVDSAFPAVASAAEHLQVEGWPAVTRLPITVNSVRFEVGSVVFANRNIEWLVVVGLNTSCPHGHIWHAEEGSCVQCGPGFQPADDRCVECPLRHAGTDGSCTPCEGSQMTNVERTACETCPQNHVPSADGLACVPCPAGQVPDAHGAACVCAEGYYDKAFGLIFCFEIGWQSDPVKASSDAFPQKARVELASGNLCLPCPDCVQCNRSDTAPVPATGWGLSPLGERIWTDGLNTNTTRYVLDPGLLEQVVREDPGSSTWTAEHKMEELRSLHTDHVRDSDPWTSSFAAYAHDCLSRTDATTALCSETFAGEDQLNAYCDFDSPTVTCKPAVHRLSLNRSLFKCPDMEGGKSSCDAPMHLVDGNSSVGTSQCAPLHTGTLCSECKSEHGRLFLPTLQGGMKTQCSPCEKGGMKFAITLVALGLATVLAFWVVAYLDKQNAKLDEVRVHYTIVAKVKQAVSNLTGDKNNDSESELKTSVVETARVIVGNLQIIGTLPVVFEAKFVKHLRFSQWIFDIRDLFQLDVFGLMSIDCIVRTSIYTRFFFTLAVPILLIAFIRARKAFQRLRWHRRKRNLDQPADNTPVKLDLMRTASVIMIAKKMREKIQHARSKQAASLCFAVIFFFYPVVSSAIFQMLDCRDVDFGQAWHTYDLSVDCHSTMYRGVRLLTWVLLFLLPLGIPTFFGTLLYMNRERLVVDKSSDIQLEVFAKMCRTLYPHCDQTTLEDLFEDVDTDGSGALSQQEIHSYAFFHELQRRVAASRHNVATQELKLLRTKAKEIRQMRAATNYVQHSAADKQSPSKPDQVDTSDASAKAKLFADDTAKHQKAAERTIHVGRIPELQAREKSLLRDAFAHFGQVAFLTVHRRPFQGVHRNWALVTFTNPRSAEKALEAAASEGGVAVVDREEIRCVLVCSHFDVDAAFKARAEAKRLWEKERDAVIAEKRAWWYGTKDDFSFLVKLYRPSMYWFEIFVFVKKLVLAGVIVFVQPGSITQLYVAMVAAFISIGILERYQPYAKAQTMKIARIAEINLFLTLSFVLMMETDLDGEPLSYKFYDFVMVMLTATTSVLPIVIAICISLGRIYNLWADSDPTVVKGDAVQVIDAQGPEREKYLNCAGKIVSETPKECTVDSILSVEVIPRDESDVLESKRPRSSQHCRLALRTCQRWFCCSCVKGKWKVGQLQIGEQTKDPVVLQMQRSQLRKIKDKKKVLLELCKVCVHTLRLGRAVTDENNTLEEAENKTNKLHNTGMQDGEVSNAAFANSLLKKLKPILEPKINAKGLLWDPVLPYLKKIFNVDELKKALQDPEAAIRMLLENPVIRRMILEGLRKKLEPLVVASNLTWLVFRSAFDMITEPDQIEECLKDPHAFFEYMLKKGGVICKVLIAALQPKIEHLAAEQSMAWIVVVSALEGMATVEMLLIAHETPESWWKSILPKLSGAKTDIEKPIVRFRKAATVAMVASGAHHHQQQQHPAAAAVDAGQYAASLPPSIRLMPAESVSTPALENNARSPPKRTVVHL